MSRTQKVLKWAGEAVKLRPFQVASMPASTMSAAEPGRRVWPRTARRNRMRIPLAQSARLAGCSQSVTDTSPVDLTAP
jgi:hypothetical protein